MGVGIREGRLEGGGKMDAVIWLRMLCYNMQRCATQCNPILCSLQPSHPYFPHATASPPLSSIP